MIKNCKTYWEIIDSLCDDFARVDAESENGTLKILTDERTYLRVINVKTGKTAVAKCRKDDVFDYRIGLATAWARYNGRSFTVTDDMRLSDLSCGDCFVVVQKSSSGEADYSPIYVVDSFVDGGKYIFAKFIDMRDATGVRSVYKKFKCDTVVRVRRSVK